MTSSNSVNLLIPDLESLNDENPSEPDLKTEKFEKSNSQRRRKVEKKTLKPSHQDDTSDDERYEKDAETDSIDNSSCSMLGFRWDAYGDAQDSTKPCAPSHSKSNNSERRYVHKRTTEKRKPPSRSKSSDAIDLVKMRRASSEERLQKKKSLKRSKSNDDKLLLLKGIAASNSLSESRFSDKNSLNENGKSTSIAERKAANCSESADEAGLGQKTEAVSAERSQKRKPIKRSKSNDDTLLRMKDAARSSSQNKDKSSNQKPGEVGISTSEHSVLRRPPRRSKSSDSLVTDLRRISGKSRRSQRSSVQSLSEKRATRTSAARRRKSNDELAHISKEEIDLDVEKDALIEEVQMLMKECQGLSLTNELNESCRELVEDCEKLIVDCRNVFAEKGESSRSIKSTDLGHEGNGEVSSQRRSTPAAYLGKYLDKHRDSVDGDWETVKDDKSLISTGDETVRTLSRRNKLKNRANAMKGKTDDRLSRPNRRRSSISDLKRSISSRSLNFKPGDSTKSHSLSLGDLNLSSHLDVSVDKGSLEVHELCSLRREITKSSEKNSLLSNSLEDEHCEYFTDSEKSSILNPEDDQDGKDIREVLQFSPESNSDDVVSILFVETENEEDPKQNVTKQDDENSCGDSVTEGIDADKRNKTKLDAAKKCKTKKRGGKDEKKTTKTKKCDGRDGQKGKAKKKKKEFANHKIRK